MGTLIKAITGVSLALLLTGQAPALGFGPALRQAGAEIASTHPKERLRAAFLERWAILLEEFPAQNDTRHGVDGGEFQAHALQSGQ